MIKTLGDLEKALRAEGYKRNVSKAIRRLAKYLVERDIIDSNSYEKIKKIAKLKATGVREVFVSDDDIRKAYAEVQKRGKPAETLFLLLVYSGIRLKQAVELLRTYDPTKLYPPIDDKAARYPIFSTSKGKKKAFWAYGPRDFFERLKPPLEVKYNTAKDLVAFGKVSANSIRKWHYTFLIQQGMPADIADFIQGRVSGSVGATHYLNKAVLADEWYSTVVDDLKRVLEGGE
ncbi:integrase [Thermococcus sp. JCM 11816]|uniref:integrase n=1 Tax=Thermococcus sp. (strain JCM 11816 / KS-1) TaxID=1295125 RepID=UPI0034670852